MLWYLARKEWKIRSTDETNVVNGRLALNAMREEALADCGKGLIYHLPVLRPHGSTVRLNRLILERL